MGFFVDKLGILYQDLNVICNLCFYFFLFIWFKFLVFCLVLRFFVCMVYKGYGNMEELLVFERDLDIQGMLILFLLLRINVYEYYVVDIVLR